MRNIQKTDIRCAYNFYVCCDDDGTHCNKCGWCPDVDEKRKEKAKHLTKPFPSPNVLRQLNVRNVKVDEITAEEIDRFNGTEMTKEDYKRMMNISYKKELRENERKQIL